MILTHGGALSNLALFLAIDAGLLDARGLDVTVPALDGFASTASRLRDGTADVGTTGFTQPLADADDADSLVIVAGSGIRGMALLGRPGTDLARLEGVVGTFTDDPMQVLLADVLRHAGREDVVEIRIMGSLREAADALSSGDVQAVTTVEPWISRLVARGAVVLSDGSDVWDGDYPDTVLVARRSTVASRPGEIEAVISALRDAERRIAADPGGALAIVAHRFPSFSPAELRAGLAGQPPRVDLRGLETTILARWPTVRRLAGGPVGQPPPGLVDLTRLAAVCAREASPSPLERNPHVH